MKIVLASTSTIRAKLLRAAGVHFLTASPEVDEANLRAANPHWAVSEVAGMLAEAKAKDVSARMTGHLSIGADQTLLLGDEIFGKPKTIREAREQLARLRGRMHLLQSSLCCVLDGRAVWTYTEQAEMSMRDFSETFLNSYLAVIGDDCLTSVGGYKIEESGIQLFESISGSYHTILGLPLLPLLSFLRGKGLIAT